MVAIWEPGVSVIGHLGLTLPRDRSGTSIAINE